MLVLVGLVSVLLANSVTAPARAEIVGGDVPVNQSARDPRDLSAHNSPSLVRNPRDLANLAVANRIDTPVFSCALHVTFDGGASWGPTQIPIPESEEPKCYAPDVAFGIDGTMYLSFVTLEGLGNVPNAVWLATSRDGGRTVSPPTRVLGPLAFQTRLVTDPRDARRLHLVWLQAGATGTLKFPETGYPIQFMSSDDGGATWGNPVRVSSAERERVVAPALAVGPDGELYVAYLDLGDDRLDYEGGHEGRGGEPYPGKWELVVARSTDGGIRWQETAVDDLVPTERFLVFLPPLPSVAADDEGRVYLSFHDGREGDADVWLWRSADGGRRFSAPVRVNDAARRDGTAQYLPRLAVAPGGRVDVVYYDRRADPDGHMNQVSFQSSHDGGLTFGPSVRLGDRPFDARIGFGSERGMPDLGNRLGLVSTERRAMAVWTDTRAGTEASNKQDLVRALVEIAPPGGLGSGAATGLRYGGIGIAAIGIVVFVSWVRGGRRRAGPETVPLAAS